MERIVLAAPRGFCAGVEMAIKALAWMVRAFEPPVYCYHEIVHNQLVVDRFRDLGVVFVDDIAEVPPGRPIMLSAHGSAPEVVAAAVVGVGPAGTQQVVVVVVPEGSASRRHPLAEADLTAAVRRVAGTDVAAVLAVPRLPTDIRHNSKIDRAAVGAWASRVLTGARPGKLA